MVPILQSRAAGAALAAGAELAGAGAALEAAGAALDSVLVLLPPHAARASEATPRTAAVLRTVVRFILLLG
jgi:hypothetical protein